MASCTTMDCPSALGLIRPRKISMLRGMLSGPTPSTLDLQGDGGCPAFQFDRVALLFRMDMFVNLDYWISNEFLISMPNDPPADFLDVAAAGS